MSPDLLPFLPFIARSKAVHFVYELATQRVVYVSAAYARLTGEPAEYVNQAVPGWLARVHPDDWQHLCQQVEQAGLGELVEDVELRVARPSGDTQWLCATVCRSHMADGKPCLSGTVRDMTRSKATAINAQKFNTKKDATLEILSHDLAAPLALMQQLTTELRAESQPSATAFTHELLQLMERTCQQGINLIRDFVDNEFLESASVVLKQERTDLGAWLRLIVEEYQRSGRHMHLHFAFHGPPHPIYAELDINKFQQVINNLFSNAIKFTPAGGSIHLRLEQRTNQASITVSDTGVGIPAPLQPILFDKFTQARRPGLRGEKTTGLGMSVIKTIVELHHGTIRFVSTEEHGTVFTIELPALVDGDSS
ncbi:PAS domain-containing sensor histidine kinase [Hymenobacter sediminis]|uniref:PAS domain-containing sensor histidine kinase n=1 Tax=Hymenobacter sediminis TaxID=2218621 RepID=UPI0013902883|nr:PAS domain-containing sensor histidine kinase [Hymenobacter sediminis]